MSASRSASFPQPVLVSVLPPCDSRCVPRVRINPRRRHARRSNSSSATVSCAESFFLGGKPAEKPRPTISASFHGKATASYTFFFQVIIDYRS